LKKIRKEFIGYSTYDTSAEIERKVKKWHLYSKDFKSNSFIIKIIRAGFLKSQYLFGYKRNNKIEFKKGTQWVSITNNMVKIILQQEKEIKKTYTHTFCPDEIFIQTICWNSNLKKNIYDLNNEGKGCLRAINWVDNVILEWQEKDIDGLLNGESILARKFSFAQLRLVNLILDKLNNKNE
jgi:Core-2/I-Branching enzyme.